MPFRTSFVAILIVQLIFASCNSREQEKKQADERLEKIRQLITENKLNEAKSQIDSIHALFPRLVSKRKMAVALKDTIILRESHRTLNYCEKVLPELKASYEQLEKNFILQKNEKYEETGKYVYKTQLAEQNTGRNYLKYEVDENGDVYLTSVYSGTKINQNAVRVEAAGMSIQTDSETKNTGVLNAFSDGERYYEELTFKNEAENGIASFIAKNKLLTLKVTLTGSKQQSYILNAKDKEAISTAYLFAMARKTLKNTEKDMRIAQQRIGKINLLYKE